MELEKKLVKLRKQSGMSQLEVAEELSVSRQAISRWEVGSAVPSSDNLRLLSKLYHVSLDYLMDDTAEEPEQMSAQGQKAPEKQQPSMGKLGGVFAFVLLVGAILLFLVYDQGKEKESRPFRELQEEEVTMAPEEPFPIVGIQ